MCGIVGVGCFQASGLWFSQVDIFRQMLITDSLRGVDGAGICRVQKEGVTSYHKVKGSGFDLLRCNGVYSWLQDSIKENDRVLIGHNRFASVGSKTTKNAHPFSVDHITLVHNGYISNLSEFGKRPKQFEVDSEGLTFAIAKRGIKDVLAKLKGAYAIVYFDEKEKTLNFCRNKDRPMFIGFDAVTKKLVFASEKPMIEWILDRSHSANDYSTIEELPDHTLMSFDFEGHQTQESYEPPKTYCHQPYSQSNEETLYDWECDPDTNTYVYTPKPLAPVEPPPSPNRGIMKTITDAYRNRGGKKYDFPDQLFGFKKDDEIEFMGMDKIKASSTQDQWCVEGSHPMYDKLVVRCFVKGEKTANTLIDEAVMIKATVRSMKHDEEGRPIIFVSDPIPIFEDQSKVKYTKNEQGVLLLPTPVTKH